MIEVIRILRKISTNRYYIVNCSTRKKRVITKKGAMAICKVFDVEVEDFDVLVEV
jgi:hypothetical protein